MSTPQHTPGLKTKVIFRKWHSGQIIALFPEIPHDLNGIYCSSYEQTGQHGAADDRGTVSRTTPASAQESAELSTELMRIGYDLQPISRVPSNAYAVRKAAISQARSALAKAGA